jgi:transcription elongation factor GreA
MTTDATSNQITPQGLEELRQELEHLEGTRRKEIAERIRTARAFGDLKENSEYHDAKNEQAFLETKITKLRERLTQAVVVEGDQGSGARFGSHVTLRDEESGNEIAYRLVGATEANLSEGKLSIESPVAQAVVGRGVGDKVKVPAPGGERAYTVVAIG